MNADTETITDEQLEKLRESAYAARNYRLVRLTLVAQNERGPIGHSARQRCADAIGKIAAKEADRG